MNKQPMKSNNMIFRISYYYIENLQAIILEWIVFVDFSSYYNTFVHIVVVLPSLWVNFSQFMIAILFPLMDESSQT